jgi:hypothetical protein
MPGYKLEPNTNGPTMKQKVRFVLKNRGASKAVSGPAESAIDGVEESLGTFIRSVYTRSNVSTHTPTDKAEGLALLRALTEINLVCTQGARVKVVSSEVSVPCGELSLEQAMQCSSNTVEKVESVNSVVAVHYQERKSEEWGARSDAIPFTTRLKGNGTIKVGDRVDLVVTLSDGYFPGALADIILPANLSRISGGGGDIQRCELDFRCQASIEVPLIAKQSTDGGVQHYGVIIRDMFDPERLGSNGLTAVTIQ